MNKLSQQDDISKSKKQIKHTKSCRVYIFAQCSSLKIRVQRNHTFNIPSIPYRDYNNKHNNKHNKQRNTT